VTFAVVIVPVVIVPVVIVPVVIVAVVVIPVVTLVVPLKCALVALTDVIPIAPAESLLMIVPSFGNVKVLLPDAATGAISV
jgi:hypothetical protein